MKKVLLLTLTLAIMAIATTACDQSYTCDPKIGPNQSYRLTLGQPIKPTDAGPAPSCAALGSPDQLASGGVIDVSFPALPETSHFGIGPSSCTYQWANLDTDVGIMLGQQNLATWLRNPPGQSSELVLEVGPRTTSIGGCDYLWSLTIGWKDENDWPKEQNLLAARQLIQAHAELMNAATCPGDPLSTQRMDNCVDFWDVTLERR